MIFMCRIDRSEEMKIRQPERLVGWICVKYVQHGTVHLLMGLAYRGADLRSRNNVTYNINFG